MSAALRFVLGLAFAILGLFMMVVAALIGSVGIAALARATPTEASIVGVLFFIPAAVCVLWVQLALRLTGARTTRPTWKGHVVAGLGAVVGFFFFTGNIYPAYSRNLFALSFGALILASTLLYIGVRFDHARQTRAANGGSPDN